MKTDYSKRPIIIKLALVLVYLSASFTDALSQTAPALSIPAIFSSGMVLQQEDEILIHGNGNDGLGVYIVPEWGDTVKTEVVNGQWDAILTTPAASYQAFEIQILLKKTGEDAQLVKTLDNILFGEVWLAAGQSNMKMTMSDAGYEDLIGSTEDKYLRYFKVSEALSDEPLEHCTGNWVYTSPEKTGNISAAAWFFARALRQRLDIPVAVINASYGDSNIEAWNAANVFNENTDLKEYYIDGTSTDLPHRQASVLFNGMLNPIIPYAIRGILWYQGESSYNDMGYYARLQTCMVNDWRSKWGNDQLPFYYVQIAPYLVMGNGNGGPSPSQVQYARFREEQEKSLAMIENSGMVVTTDIGDYYDIHPKEKKAVGERLANYALAECYAMETDPYRSPIFRSLAIEGNKAVITFEEGTTGSGLVITDEDVLVPGLWIAGDDKVFHRGRLSPDNNRLIVSSDSVDVPVAVRYDFYDCIKSELFTKEGLPVSPFRTDNWDATDVRFVEFPLYSLISDFDRQNVSPYNMWGGIGYMLIQNPLVSNFNNSEYVVRISTTDFAYEGFAYKASEPMQGSRIGYLKLKVYAEDPDSFTSLLIKLEDSKGQVPYQSFEVHDLYPVGGTWDSISIPMEITGEASFDIITIMPNIWETSSEVFYFDDLEIVENPLSSEKNRSADAIRIFPNPTRDYICIEGLNGPDTSWKLYNLSGKLLKQGNISDGQYIDFSEFQSGVYYLVFPGFSRKLILK